ncbi:MAG: four helix bundle protein [Bacteroidota bacterium]
MNKYQDLRVWQKAMELVIDVYAVTDNFPDKEKFGLVSQINRSAVSVVSNIAEGAGRNNPREFNQFLGIANGSLAELETQLEISRRLKFSPMSDYETLFKLTSYIGKMIKRLQHSIKAANYKKVSEPEETYGN